jgi:hypothetical protein
MDFPFLLLEDRARYLSYHFRVCFKVTLDERSSYRYIKNGILYLQLAVI